MDKETARHIVRVAFRAAGELQELLALLKQRSGAEEYRQYALGIAAAIDGINVALINKALASYPELTGEIESSIEKRDRFI